MAVRAITWTPCAVPTGRPRREMPWIVPVAALVLAALPIWLGLDITLPRPLGRELEIVVVSQQPPLPVVETIAPGLDPLPLAVESVVMFWPPIPPHTVEKPCPRPTVAVRGEGRLDR